MDNDLATFVAISHRLGKNPFWVQGPGGNTSIKLVKGTMIVKSSGSELQQVTDTTGYAFCNTAKVNAALHEILDLNNEITREAAYADCVGAANLQPELHKRPSMELGIHTLLPFKYVLHFHSPCGLIASHLKKKSKLARLPSASEYGFHISWIDSCLPGFLLAEQVLRLGIEPGPTPQLIILENHGIILAADMEPQKMLDDYAAWESAFWNALNPRFPYNKISKRQELYEYAAKKPVDKAPLYPDSVILESRISKVLKDATDNTFCLDQAKAQHDTGAADIFAVECLIKNHFLDIAAIEPKAQQQIRDMPTEIARMKQMQDTGK